MACTPLRIFDDVAEVVHALPGTTPRELARGLLSLLGDPARLGSVTARQGQWLESHSWKVLGRRLAGLVRALVFDEPAEAGVSRIVEARVERGGEERWPTKAPLAAPMN